MKLYLMYVSNGNLQVAKIEEFTDPDKALAAFHSKCATLCANKDVITAMVKLLDENLDNWQGKMEYITHEPQVVEPTPEPEPEPEE